MNVLRTAFVVVATLVASAIFTSEAYACSCAPTQTVDREFSRAVNIVILKVRSLEKTGKPEVPLVQSGGIKYTNLSVERVFKGALKPGQELQIAQGGGADCIWTFSEADIGEEFLFYLDERPKGNGQFASGVIAAAGQFPKQINAGTWLAWTCSRSGNVSRRAADILYFDNFDSAKGRTRLSGTVSRSTQPIRAGEAWRNEALEGHKVRVIGNGKSLELTTDKNGVYEAYDLPPGRYTVTVAKIPGFSTGFARDNVSSVILPPRGHAERDFYFQIDNAVRGKMYDPNGSPMKDVCIYLEPADGKASRYFHESDCTDPDGSWEIDDVPQGTYILVVNKQGEITSTTPFPAFYHPATRRIEEAMKLTIGPGQIIDGLKIVAPDILELLTISGRLVYEDGNPAVEETVEFLQDATMADRKADGYKPADARGKTDSAGNFTIRVLKGQSGFVLGSLTTYRGKYVDCPKLDKFIEVGRSGISITDVYTEPVRFDGQQSTGGVDLKFPFPACKRKRN